MRARDLAYETVSALDANRGRSALTILGIVIGISAVIAMTALVGGVRQMIVSELGLNQARLVYLAAWVDRTITLDDLHNLEEQMPQYECLTATSYASAEVKNETKSFNGNVQGVLPSYFTVMGSELAEGSFFTEDDEEGGNLVAVVDQATIKQLYGNPDERVVGRSIQLDNVSYHIVGVLDASTQSMGGNGTVYLPFSTCAARLTGDWSVYDMSGLAAEDANMDTIVESTRRTLVRYFNIPEDEAEDSTYIVTMKSIIDDLNQTLALFQLLMTSVSSISLLVGGIGIMNMMLTNVTERIREIGLRKALGARSSDITKQFLLESVCLCLVGGVIGIVLGYGASFTLSGIAEGFVSAAADSSAQFVPVIDVQSVAMATGICVLIGVVFGYYPARRAAKLDPIEALHYQ